MSPISETELIKQIELEFSGGGTPESVLHQLRMFRSPGYEEDEELCRSFDVQSWMLSPNSILASKMICFSIFPEDAWEYFLPAFMVATLSDSMDGESAHNLINTLLPIRPRGEVPQLGIRMDRFTSGQMKCFRLFLTWYRDNCVSEWSKMYRRIDRFLNSNATTSENNS